MMTANLPYIGCGLYTTRDVANILHVPTRSLRRWSEGYWYRLPAGRGQVQRKEPCQGQGVLDMDTPAMQPECSQSQADELRFSPQVVRRDLPLMAGKRVYTFTELIELRFVSWLREQDVPMQAIRSAAEAAVELFGADHPFALEEFATDGLRIFALLRERTHDPGTASRLLVQELPKFQYVFTQMVEPYFKDLEFGDKWAMRWWPMGRNKRIVLDPSRRFGEPIDDETGVPVSSLYGTYSAEKNMKRVAWWYDVPVSAVKYAVEYQRSFGG